MNKRFMTIGRAAMVLIVVSLIAVAVVPGHAETPAMAPQATIFAEDFEGDVSDWTTTGFWHQVTNPQNIPVLHSGPTTPEDPPNDINPDLVTLPDLDASGNAYLPSAHGGSSVMWYGVDDNGTFIDDPFDLSFQTAKNGGRSTAANSGTLDSPPIDLSAVSEATLSFWTWWEIEGVDVDQFDMMYVEVSTAGASGPFTNIGSLNPLNDVNNLPEQNYSSGGSNTPGVWVESVWDLTSYAGQTIVLRFRFDTRDALYNGFRGWLIDGLQVQSGGALAPQISSVFPDCVDINEIETAIVNIYGSNFVSGASVTVGGQPAANVSVISASKIQIFLPSTLGVGTYDMTVINPDTQSDTLADAVTVQDGPCALYNLYLPITLKNH